MTGRPVTRRAALAGAAAAPAALAAPALAQTKRFRLVTSWSEQLPILPASAQRLAASVEALSGGALAFEVVNAGADHGAFDVLDLVARGEADAYHSLEQNWQDRHPAYAYFTTVPFGLTAEEMSSWLLFGGGLDLWRELAAREGIFPIAVGNTGCQMGGWFAEKATSLDALQGARMNVAGIGAR
ncbi:MAG: ABC transporter substrate-binding protein, partial [Pseudomonadota bacterium]